MRRGVWLVLGAFLLFIVLPLPIAAETVYEEQLAASGGDTLTKKLPADVQALLEELQLDVADPGGFTALSAQRVWSMLNELVAAEKNTPLRAAASLMAVLVLSAMFGGLEGMTDRPALRQSYHTVAVLSAAGLLLPAVCDLMAQVSRAVDSAGVFLLSFVPIYGGVVAVSGGAGAALSYQTTLLTAVELFGQLCRGAVLPMLSVSMAMGCAGAVTDGFSLEGLSNTIQRVILWGMGLFSTVFSGVLSIQQMVAAAGDSFGRRAVKFSLSSFVPVVGGVLSEAYSTVLGCAGLLRSTLGCFGLVATVLIVLPPLVSCVMWNVLLWIAGGAATLFRLNAVEKLCKSVAGGIKVMIGILALFSLLMIISTAVVIFAGRGIQGG